MAEPLNSAPPPTTGPPGAGNRHEHLIELESSGRWKRKKTVDFLKFSPLGMELHHSGVLVMPLTMPLGAIALATTETGPVKPMAGEGRFPVLKRISGSTVVPREEGVEGWLWTAAGGSAFPSLCDEDEAPNVAILFAHPLGEEMINRRFLPEFAQALAARSALGSPVVYGLLMRVRDILPAERVFTKFGVAKVLTDREVGPTLRRSLPTDKPADPMVRISDRSRESHSVAPPGVV
ncbi:MAG: hypothetical protein ABI611_15680 [Solirubrobacteraceae bacterium]